MSIKTYREWAPSSFDIRGLGLEDKQDWLVVPVIQTRDSDALEQSNYRTALKWLGGESETVETHSFGHWACGHYDVILAAPTRYADVLEIQQALENYPILSEDDMSQLEAELDESDDVEPTAELDKPGAGRYDE